MASNKSFSRARSISLIDDGRKTHSPKLCLCGLSLSELPSGVFSHPFPECLEILDLSNNKLHILDQKVCLLSNLTELILSGNCLKKIPNEIGFLRQLVTLDLSRNTLECLPKPINNLKELMVVNLNGNNLKVMPHFLLCLPKLRKVFCIRNQSLENVPKNVAANGLYAMREYLEIKVEKYESDSEQKRLTRNGCKELLLSEISQKWILEEDRLMKRTKDVSTQLTEEDDGDFEDSLSHKIGEISVRETSASTQTYVSDLDPEDQLPVREQSFFNCSGDSDSDVSLSKKDLRSDEDKALENLVKIFHKQVKLVSEYRGKEKELARKSSCKDSVFDDGFSKVSRSEIQCHSCGLKRRESMSEYGSMSSSSENFYTNTFADEDGSCDGNSGSHCGYLSDFDDQNELDEPLGEAAECNVDDSKDDSWYSEQQQFINACKELVIRQNGIELKVPESNLSGHSQKDFAFEVVNSFEYSPFLEGNEILATPIVRVNPHGARFYSSMEAVVKLPLNVVMENGVMLKCLASDTASSEATCWEKIQEDRFEVIGNRVNIRTNHFSFFCATASKEYPRVEQRVSALNGGTLACNDVVGLEVEFPRNCLKSDMDISLTVLYDDPKYKPKHIEQPIATPLIVLEPSGVSFEEDVTVTLPLPDAKAVCKVTPYPELLILESQTSLNESPRWREIKVPYDIKDENGVFTAAFKVKHFTMFAAAWKKIVSTATAARDIAGALFSPFTYRVYFQALMSDVGYHHKQFGICVLCHLAGNPPVTDSSQFPLEVGRSQPRDLSRGGDISIELKSKKFTADQDVVGSENGLIKMERFNGLEFDKQFALKFNEAFKDGIFGTVIITMKESGADAKLLTEFLLQKAMRRRPKRKPTILETKLTQEIAGLLAIEDRWKELGITLGYTRNEINHKFSPENPLDELLTDFMSRGGEASDLIRAMYEVARRLKLISYDPKVENRENRNMENRLQASSNSRYCNCSNRSERTPLVKAKRKLIDRDFDDDDDNDNDNEELSDAKMDRLAGQISEKWKHVGRALDIDQAKIAEIDLNNRYEGGREKAFQMFAVWKEMFPEQFSYFNLKKALSQCGLNNTAKRLANI